MEFILEIINTYGLELIGTALIALGGILGKVATKLATKYINTKIKREIARTVVQGVEQCYRALGGPEKLAKAMEAAADMLAAEGITVTELELRMLLEAAVGEFNDVFAYPILDGIAVEDMTDDQLRSVLQQMGLSHTYTDGLTREQLLAELDNLAAAAE